ncbi:MAG: hypothetical protein AAB426_01210 [Myxococcota bacterium]
MSATLVIAATGACGDDMNDAVDQGPPVGLSVVAATPGTAEGDFGRHPAIALDGQGHPLVAWAFSDPDRDSSDADSKLTFVAWDRSTKSWKTPIDVDLVLDQAGSQPAHSVAIAHDAQTNAIAIAYTKGLYQLWLATSMDGGATWATRRIDVSDAFNSEADPNREVAMPSIVLHAGEVHLTYQHRCIKATRNDVICGSVVDSDAIVYLHSATLDGPLTESLSPSLAGTQDARTVSSLALDGAGDPGVAFLLKASNSAVGPEAYNTTVAFWRPGTGAIVEVTDSANIQNDDPSVSLAFAGTKPRIAMHLNSSSPQSHDLWFADSDDGATWRLTGIARDGGDETSWWQSLVIGAQEESVIAASFGSSSGAGNFGGPKIFRSPDLTTWAPSSPDAEILPSFAGRYVRMTATASGKLYMVFQYTSDNASLPKGVVLWREP